MRKVLFFNALSLLVIMIIGEPKTLLGEYVFYAAIFTISGSILLSPLIYIMTRKPY
ncbi:hypothetical protein [Pectobacterium versatile]|uniref:hypothetical protein n=1 Tax=Pectobacterium versatile TaxID=2488639 RepID=UPI001F31DEC3|nr:hypothetical protein [Pectobacterium versatile]